MVSTKELMNMVPAHSPAEATIHITLRDRAVDTLADAMADRALLNEPTARMTGRAALIVDAILDLVGRPFAVLLDGSTTDATALATAVRSVGNGHTATEQDVALAGAAITALVESMPRLGT